MLNDAGPDGGVDAFVPPAVCNVNMPGTVPGSNCNRGTCNGGMACNAPVTGVAIPDIESADGREMAAYPIHMYPDELAMPLGGGHCGNFCDVEGPTTQCGECGICADSPLQGRIRLGWLTSDGRFDFNAGMCAFPCVPAPGTNGGCREGYACDTTEGFCTASCFNDQQCQFGVAPNEFGLGDIVYDGSASPWVCNTTTGMCEPSTPTVAVGEACETNADCPAFGGFCIQGTCMQGGCGFEGGFECGADEFCVGISSLGRAGFCIAGCTTGDDCLSGNGCVPLETEGAICFPFCENDSQCRSDERCDLSLSTDGTSGACAPACDPAVPDSCGTDEVCEAAPVEGGGTENFCHTINQICEADTDCNGGQRCELWPDAAFTGDLGMCQDACTAGGSECDVDEFCNLRGGTMGLCRKLNGYCAGASDCGRGQTCAIDAGDATGFCEGTPAP